MTPQQAKTNFKPTWKFPYKGIEKKGTQEWLVAAKNYLDKQFDKLGARLPETIKAYQNNSWVEAAGNKRIGEVSLPNQSQDVELKIPIPSEVVRQAEANTPE